MPFPLLNEVLWTAWPGGPALAAAALLAVAIELWLARRNLAHLARAHLAGEAAGSGSASAIALAAGRTRMGAMAMTARFIALMGLLAVGPAVAQAWLLPAAVLAGQAIQTAAAIWEARVLRPRAGLPPLHGRPGAGHLRRITGALLAALAVDGAVMAAGRGWWLAAWAAWLSVLIWQELAPPMGRRLEPAERGRYAPLAAAAQRSIAALRLYVSSDGGPQANARAEGVGPWRRIVLTEGLVRLLDDEALTAVIGHELGHLRGRHRELLLLWRVTQALLVLFAASFAPPGQGPFLAAALVLAAPLLSFLTKPAETAALVAWEHAADEFAASFAGRQALAAALSSLFSANPTLLTADPFYASFHGSHPPPAERLRRLEPSR